MPVKSFSVHQWLKEQEARSKLVRRRVTEVGEMPHVKAWMEEFKRVCASMPQELWVYAGSHIGSQGADVLVKDANGSPFMNGEGVDQDAVLFEVEGTFDGGDY